MLALKEKPLTGHTNTILRVTRAAKTRKKGDKGLGVVWEVDGRCHSSWRAKKDDGRRGQHVEVINDEKGTKRSTPRRMAGSTTTRGWERNGQRSSSIKKAVGEHTAYA